MYHFADKSYESLPKFLSEENRLALAKRIAEYASENKLEEVFIAFHGGEPLLVGEAAIAQTCKLIEAKLPEGTTASFSIQTNGLLLTQDIINIFREHKISISLSLDGDKSANDLHRLDHKGKSTFAKTEKALDLLTQNSDIFGGVISVIDVRTKPTDIFSYFKSKGASKIDLLLPDANHNTPPPYRDKNNPNIYVDWLKEAFDIWLHDYSADIEIRTFEAILNCLQGLPSQTDSFGFGDVSLLTIETDGSYHGLDVLRITKEGESNLQVGTVKTASISEAATSEKIESHRQILRKGGVSSTCQSCDLVDICGGGSVPHRFSTEHGYNQPSIYCDELYQLISHAKLRLEELEQAENEQHLIDEQNILDQLPDFEAGANSNLMTFLLNEWKEYALDGFTEALGYLRKQGINTSTVDNLSEEERKTLAIMPSVSLWTKVVTNASCGQDTEDFDEKKIPIDAGYLAKMPSLLQETNKPKLQREDKWLRCLFASKYTFEESNILAKAEKQIEDAYDVIRDWNPEILSEIFLISKEIQLARDPLGDNKNIFSLSDNDVPGALYLSVRLNNGQNIDKYDLAESIIHEYRHHRLYLLQRFVKVAEDNKLVSSPWKKELRPPTGLFHAMYVFIALRDYWKHVATSEDTEVQKKAKNSLILIDEKLKKGLPTIKDCSLGKAGKYLIGRLETSLGNQTNYFVQSDKVLA